MRTILDTAQVMPAFCYLLPLVVAFGIGIPPAVMATVIYASFFVVMANALVDVLYAYLDPRVRDA